MMSTHAHMLAAAHRCFSLYLKVAQSLSNCVVKLMAWWVDQAVMQTLVQGTQSCVYVECVLAGHSRGAQAGCSTARGCSTSACCAFTCCR